MLAYASDKREGPIIYKRFYEDRPLEEIAIEFSVGRERIRQIEGKALRTLRHPRFAKLLWPERYKHVEIKYTLEPGPEPPPKKIKEPATLQEIVRKAEREAYNEYREREHKKLRREIAILKEQ